MSKITGILKVIKSIKPAYNKVASSVGKNEALMRHEYPGPVSPIGRRIHGKMDTKVPLETTTSTGKKKNLKNIAKTKGKRADKNQQEVDEAMIKKIKDWEREVAKTSLVVGKSKIKTGAKIGLGTSWLGAEAQRYTDNQKKEALKKMKGKNNG